MEINMRYHFFLFLPIFIFLTSCSGTKFLTLEQEEDRVPEWFVELKDEDERHIYAVATSTSNDLQLSIEKSKMLALNNLGQKIKGVLSSEYNLSTNSEDPITSGDINLIVKNFSTKGFKEVEKEILKTFNNKYRTYLKISFEKELIQSFDAFIIVKR